MIVTIGQKEKEIEILPVDYYSTIDGKSMVTIGTLSFDI
jgi:hypothetical protein